jgi:hypothetical protein
VTKNDIVDHAALWVGSEPILVSSRSNLPPGVQIKAGTSIAESGRLMVDGTNQGARVVLVLDPVPVVLGNTNCDQHVDVQDLVEVILNWGPCPNCGADVDANGEVNADDLITVIVNWGI